MSNRTFIGTSPPPAGREVTSSMSLREVESTLEAMGEIANAWRGEGMTQEQVTIIALISCIESLAKIIRRVEAADSNA